MTFFRLIPEFNSAPDIAKNNANTIVSGKNIAVMAEKISQKTRAIIRKVPKPTIPRIPSTNLGVDELLLLFFPLIKALSASSPVINRGPPKRRLDCAKYPNLVRWVACTPLLPSGLSRPGSRVVDPAIPVLQCWIN